MKKQPRTELPKGVESMTIEWEVFPVTYIRRANDNEMISYSVYYPIDELYWNSKREQVEQSFDRMMGKIRTPGLRSRFQVCIDELMKRANHPDVYIPEAVDDARHDLLILFGLISNGVDDDES